LSVSGRKKDVLREVDWLEDDRLAAVRNQYFSVHKIYKIDSR